jgi:hypothetical protein
MQKGAHRTAQEIDSTRGDVFTHVSGFDGKPCRVELVMQLRVNQVDLPKIRLRRVCTHTRAMLDSFPCVAVAFDSEICNEPDELLARLAE